MSSALNVYCGSPFWDYDLTWNTTDPNLTRCFQRTVLVWTPCLFLWCFAPVEIILIHRYQRRPLDKTILNQSKLALTMTLIITQVVEYFYVLYHHYEGEKYYSVDFYTPIIKFVTLCLCLILLWLAFKKGKHTSGVLFLFWLITTLCSAVEFYTYIKEAIVSPAIISTFPFILYCIYLISCIGELILSAFADNSPSVRALYTLENRSPEETASFLSRLTFSWFDRMIWIGFKRPLTVEDLWTLKNSYRTENVSLNFDRAWEIEIQKAHQYTLKRNMQSLSYESLPERESHPPHYRKSITKALWRTFGSTFCFGTFLKMLGDLCGLATPLLLRELISFVESNAPLWQGILYVILLCLGTILESQLLNQQWDIIMNLSLRVKSALISAIYKKSLKISNSSKRTATAGEIVNLMSVDAQRMSEMLIDLPSAFTFPVQISIALYMMWQLMGVAALISLSVFAIIFPINTVLARKIEKLELLIMEYKDERIKIMNEILAGMKVLKLYAWEPSFNDQIAAVRKKELSAMKKVAWMNSFLWFLFNCAPYMIALTMFTSYILLDSNNSLTATKAFVSISLLHILQEPLSFAPIIIAVVVQMRVSVKRVNNFMNLEELDDDQIDHDESDDALFIENGTFAWQVDAAPTLADITLKVPQGSLIAIVGPVGAGKSSLIMALLGEMEKIQGKVNTYGSVAYVPQVAWIQNATLKDNILFGKAVDETRYNTIVDACALRPDFAILPGGDVTEIGEKGINLSGGQKQRVSLARAVYNDADIYLLDDPLSAVDSHVGKHIFDHVIGPNSLLKQKTRILVTHGLVHLAEVDVIIMLEEGRIVERGSYKDLLEGQGHFTELLKLSQIGDSSTKDKEKSAGDIHHIGSPYKYGSESERILRQISRTLSINSVGSDDSSMIDSNPKLNKIAPAANYQDPKLMQNDDNKGNLISLETIETGQVGWKVYRHYLASIGTIACIGTLLLFMIGWAFAASTNVWLKYWSNDPPGDVALTNMRLGVYGALCAFQSVFMLTGYVVAQLAMLRASRVLHENMLLKILRSPMSFFDVTPLGRIINRFSHDVDTVDSTLPNIIIFMLELFFQLIGIVVIICMTNILVAVVLVPISVLYYVTQKFYISTSRQLKRIASNYRSPIYSHFSETLSGLATIRAFKMEEPFVKESNSKVDANHKAVYPSYSARRWLTVRLDFLGSVVIFSTALFAVMKRDSLDPGTLGLSVSYAVTITFVFNWLAKMTSELETYIVSVERIKEYTEIPSEAKWKFDAEKLSPSWPKEGRLTFINYSTRYREGLDLVLKDISFEICSGEKIGVIGRTGAGKSSLTLALFRLIEPTCGKIIIDGVNIAQLGLHSIRSRLTIIPQDPVLFCGTLRMNLDPFNQFTDQQLWYALEHSHLKEFVSTLEEGLQYPVAEGGENLSVGQRQLLCLARALLRKSKILVLDEATAAVDLETDELIQATIRKEFAECTILTIAHRLNTIMDSTRVLVLQNGIIKEFESPTTLLQDQSSLFYSMAKDAGLAL